MLDSYPYPIDCLFDNTSEKCCVFLSHIQQHVIMLLKLNRAVNALLPAPLCFWCRVANVCQGIMVLEIANASWQMRLRYEQPQLLSALRAQILPSLSYIDIRINPSLAKKKGLNMQSNNSCQQLRQSLRGEPRYLSVQSAESIRHVATRSEGKLKKALERLAKLTVASTIPLNAHKDY